MDDKDKMLKAALAYSTLGWHVFPLLPGQKKPLIKRWQHEATIDSAKIHRWWEKNPNANIGVACGPSGIVAIDLDVKKGANGIETWQNLVEANEIEERAVIGLTPSGGQHWIYDADGVEVRNSAGTLGRGVDVRGQGGYIVVSPSELEDGSRYEWSPDARPGKHQPAPLPESLRSLLTGSGQAQKGNVAAPMAAVKATSYAQAALRGEIGKLAMARDGERNTQLNSSAFALGQLVGAGLLDQTEVTQHLTQVAQAIELGEQEIRCTVKSGLEAGIKQPRQVPGRDVARELPDLNVEPFDATRLDKRLRSLLTEGWDPNTRYGRRYDSKAAAALAVANALLKAKASDGQVARALLESPLTDWDKGLVTWLLEKAKSAGKRDASSWGLSDRLLRYLSEDETPLLYRYRRAGEILCNCLLEWGFFVVDPVTLTAYYMDEGNGHLLRIEEHNLAWQTWLHQVTEVNPATRAFKALHSAVLTRAVGEGKRVAVVRVAAWDREANVLRISRFDGTVYRLDGESITEELNGAGGILFEDDPVWEPYEPDFAPVVYRQAAAGKALDWTLTEIPSWSSDPEVQALILKAWLLSTFFPELCPTKPILGMIGEKGSGKSMVLRSILRMLFGAAGEVTGVPDKPDGFTAAAAASHVLVLDNVDTFTPWLQDKIARLTTGAVDTYRRLYTSNEMGKVAYRCFLAITARTPDTLRRDDLADRLLPLYVERVANPQPESILLDNVRALRNAWWGDLLTALNEVVALIRRRGLPIRARLRMADFESLGQVVAEAAGQAAVWDRAVQKLAGNQQEFALDGEQILDALAKWLDKPGNPGRDMLASDLYTELTETLFGDQRPSHWYRTSQGFSKRLGNIKRELQAYFQVDWRMGIAGRQKNCTVYRFSLLDEEVGMEG